MSEWRRTLGRSGLGVTAVGLGLAALGRPGYLTLGHGSDLGDDLSVAAMERHARVVMDAAYDAGVRYFDAARSYGRAEEFLATWLRARGPDDVTVGSKWGYTYTADWEIDADPPEVKDLSAEAFRRQIAETRELLGDRLALYQIHSATVESGVLEDPDVLAGLAALRAEGVAIGLSATGPAQMQTIQQAVAVGAFDAVQATFNVLEPAAGPALARAREAGMGIIVKEALANGRLTDRGDQPEWLELAREAGVAPDALALAFVISRPWVDVVLSGAATVEHLRSNLAAREVEWRPEWDARVGALMIPPDAYWAQRSDLAWN
jgi:aryl-alcohol dehydrogenase-like predicted oxidoreductase